MINFERVLAAGLCAGLAAGCKAPERSAQERAGEAEPIAEAGTSSPKQQPSPSTPALPPRAYVNVDGAGVFMLDDEHGWRLLYSPRASIRDMLEIDGQLYLLSSFGVQRLSDTGTVETLAAIDAGSYAELGEPRAMGGDGREFWVLGGKGLGHFVDGWQITPSRELPKPTTTSQGLDLAVDAEGRPWIVRWGIHRRDGAGWSPVELSLSFPIGKAELIAHRRSAAMFVYAGCGVDEARTTKTCSVVRHAGDAPSVYDLAADGCPPYAHLAISPNGELAALAGACGVQRLSLDEPGGAPRLLATGEDGWPGDPPTSLAIDDGGRVWAGAHRGLLIVGADDRVEEYPLAQLSDIAGPISAIVVGGQGPKPPTLGRERRGGLRAKAVRPDKVPIANAKVELCSRSVIPPSQRDPVTGEAKPDDMRSPCAGVELAATTTTDEQGDFEIPDVPLANYYIGVELEGRWGLGLPASMTMRAGMVGNIGKVVVLGLR